MNKFTLMRLRAGFKTQEDAAARLGLSREAVCQYETGRRMPRTPMLKKMAALYDCTVDELLADSGTEGMV